MPENSPPPDLHPKGPSFESFRANRDPQQVFEVRTKAVDTLVTAAAEEYLVSKLSSPFSVLAVGGYGRRELFPFSDIDILILVDNESDLPAAKEPVSNFLRALWDAGLRISQSVRTVLECCRVQDQNTELHISLLDLRLVAGDPELFNHLSQSLPDFYERHRTKLTQKLAELTRQRHSKFNNTVYHLEPNIKEAPGGIRDIHLLRWLSRLAPRHGPMDDSLLELDHATLFLYAIRCFLHFHSGRDNNLLSFELQDEAAEMLPENSSSPAEWMRIYYKHARLIFQSSLRALEYADAQDPGLLRQFRDWRGRLSTSEFTVSRERIFLRNPAETLLSPESILGLFIFVARHGIPLSWDTERRLRSEFPRLENLFRAQVAPWTTWSELFAQPHAALALREMQEVGLIGAAIPGWHAIDSLVVRDFYHRYTVDEHTIVAIETIDHLAANVSGTPPRFHELLAEEADVSVLRLALLLHDFGKGTVPGDHVRGSLEAADEVLPRLGVPEARGEAVRFLIEHHLDLSLVMNGRDLEDPATARFLTSRIGTQENLRRLTLLTYADINAVNPTALTPWRVEQLWRVYSVGLEQLTRELATDRIHEDPAQFASPELARFLAGLPTRYLRTHSREEIQSHFELSRKKDHFGVAVKISRDTGAYLLTVVAEDQPGLFGSLCGALASFGMNIVKAEAASNAQHCVLDMIRFTDPMRTLELNPDEIKRLEWTMECVVRRSVQVSDLLKRRRPTPRPSSGARILPRVRFSNDASDLATLIDFVGEDRPGLLYELASALSAAECDIEVVMVDTEAHKAIDVFYVTRNGEKLDLETQEQLKSELMRAAVTL